MSYVRIQDLLKKTDSMYKLVVMASRRATELNAGAPRLVEEEKAKMTSIALDEILQGKVKLSTNGKAK